MLTLRSTSALYIPTALNNISWILYIIFAAISFLAALSTWLFQPETANRGLEEMDEMFEGKSMWVFRARELTKVHPKRERASEVRDKTSTEKLEGETKYVEDS